MNGFRGLGARGKEARPQKMAAGSGNAAQKNCRKVKRPHPTQKLVELMRRPILNQTKPGKLVSAVSGQRHHTRRGSDSRVPPRNLRQEFSERLPIMSFPSRSQDFRLAFRKAGMVKYDFGSGALLHELEPRNRIDARSPAARSPGLHDALVRHKFDVSSRDVPAEERERTSHFTTDLCGLVSQVHGLHDSTELYDFVELFGVGKRFVDAFPARFENRLLMDGFRRARNLLSSRPSISRAQSQPTECDCNTDDRFPPRAPIGQRFQICSSLIIVSRNCARLFLPALKHRTKICSR